MRDWVGALTSISNANNLNVRALTPISYIRWEISLIKASPIYIYIPLFRRWISWTFFPLVWSHLNELDVFFSCYQLKWKTTVNRSIANSWNNKNVLTVTSRIRTAIQNLKIRKALIIITSCIETTNSNATSATKCSSMLLTRSSMTKWWSRSREVSYNIHFLFKFYPLFFF